MRTAISDGGLRNWGLACGFNSNASQQLPLYQGRKKRRYLQLHIPFRCVDIRVNRVIQSLQLEFHWQGPDLDELSNLRTNWKGHFVTL